MEQKDLILSIQKDLAQIKQAILSTPTANEISDKWVPRQAVMAFFSYAPTQMASLENSGDLVIAKIGKRKFILKESITKLLDKNVTNSDLQNHKANH